MIGALPSLFGKLFVIGFALPAFALLFASAAITDIHGLTHLYRAAVSVVLGANEKQLALWFGILSLSE